VVIYNISNRTVTLKDTGGTLYNISAFGNTTVDDSKLNDVEFKRWLRYRSRELVVSLGSGGGTGGISATIVDAKGDLIVGTAADTVARLAVGSNGAFLEADSATAAGVKWSARVISRGGTISKSDGVVAGDLVVWRAPYTCTVTALRGYRVGGTGATVNAIRRTAAGTNSDLSASNLSLTAADQWMAAGSVQNTAFAAGDALIISVRTVSGTPTQVAIQTDFTRP